MTPCTLTGSVNATIVGGTILNADQPFADIPKGVIAGGNFLSAGPTTTEPSTVTFGGGIDYISFLWGSPDTYNTLTVITTAGTCRLHRGGPRLQRDQRRPELTRSTCSSPPMPESTSSA